MIILENDVQKIIEEDAVQAFPNECCGFVFGHEDSNGRRHLTQAHTVTNVKEGDKRRRFEIAPQDYIDAEKYAEEQ
ncbi:MAG: Mov34/MPN/PAD-1 family protein, partial [Niastella sp.]|uniref:Mov34/MPN/PAD-1 family protein n=1 Tax=Niastella sp. TaxID=1869183 RepID=UPI00389A96DA